MAVRFWWIPRPYCHMNRILHKAEIMMNEYGYEEKVE